MSKNTVTRRGMIQTVAGVLAAQRAAAQRVNPPAPKYFVGVAAGFTGPTDGYAGTQKAIASLASAPAQYQFPNVTGKNVVIKINLVSSGLYTTGMTTDPNVCQALVDLSLQNGAAHVYIVEAGQISKGPIQPPPFSGLGWTAQFAGYTNVTLVDLDQNAMSLAAVPGGQAYGQIWTSAAMLMPNVVIMSCAPMKTHTWAVASMSTKNLFGVLPPSQYAVGGQYPRSNAHQLSLPETLTDLHRRLKVSFAVLGGPYGMQGNGPLKGSAIQLGTILCGTNQVAVDRIGKLVMFGPGSTPQVPHLDAMAAAGFGPTDAQAAAQVGTYGDQPVFLNFALPNVTWPYCAVPGLSAISVSSGSGLTITFKSQQTCNVKVDIIANNETLDTRSLGPTQRVSSLRTVADWATYPVSGVSQFVWDGNDGNGMPVPAGIYLARLSAAFNGNDQTLQENINFRCQRFTITA